GPAGVTALLVVGVDDEAAGELAVRASGRLERDGLEAGDLREHLLQLVYQLERALRSLFRLVRMKAGEAGIAGDFLVDLRVVLHGARPERIHVDVDRVVLLTQAREVADDIDLADLGPAKLVPCQVVWKLGFRHVRLRESKRAAPWFAQFVDQRLHSHEGFSRGWFRWCVLHRPDGVSCPPGGGPIQRDGSTKMLSGVP